MNKTEKALEKALRVLEGLDSTKILEGLYDIPGDDSHEQIEVEDLIPEIKALLTRDKIQNPNAAMFPACWLCKHRQVQNDWVDPQQAYIHGCSNLAGNAWSRGIKKDGSGTVYQSNCPLGQCITEFQSTPSR